MARKQVVLQKEETEAVERLIVDTQFLIHQVMKNEGVTKVELAKRLNCSKSRVSQMFGDSPNLTLDSLARVFFALKDECRVTSTKGERAIQALKHQVAAEAHDVALKDAGKWIVLESKEATLTAYLDVVKEPTSARRATGASREERAGGIRITTYSSRNTATYHREAVETYVPNRTSQPYEIAC